MLAHARTSDGVEGVGYIVSLNVMFVGAVAAATRELAGLLPGMPALDTEAAWQRMARAGDWAGPGGLLHYAIAPLDIAPLDIAPLDIALWDAAGKTLSVPPRHWTGPTWWHPPDLRLDRN